MLVAVGSTHRDRPTEPEPEPTVDDDAEGSGDTDPSSGTGETLQVPVARGDVLVASEDVP